MRKFLITFLILILISICLGQTSKQNQILITHKIAASWVPTDETSLDWWLDSDTISGNDGDAVTAWNDSSSAARNYTQGTGTNQPTLKLNILNGHRIVRFATNDKLASSGTPRTFGTTNTLVAVCTPTSGTNAYIIGSDGGEGGPAIISGFSSKAFEYFYVSSGERATFATSTSGFHILLLARTDDVGNYKGYFDGALIFNTAVNTNNDWNTRQLREIGSDGPIVSGDEFYNGDCASFLHFNTNASSDTVLLNHINSYLGTKYSISVTLN